MANSFETSASILRRIFDTRLSVFEIKTIVEITNKSDYPIIIAMLKRALNEFEIVNKGGILNVERMRNERINLRDAIDEYRKITAESEA